MIHLIICLIASLVFILLAGGVGLFARRAIGMPSSILLGIGLASAATSYLALYIKGAYLVSFFCLLVYMIGTWNWFKYLYEYFQVKKAASLNIKLGLSICSYLLLIEILPLIPLLDTKRLSREIFASPISLFTVAQNLYLNLPIDNIISATLAGATFSDTYASPLIGDWLGSDRPPLQSGLIILSSIATTRLNFDWDLSSFSASIVANSIWVLGALAFASALNLKRYLRYASILPVVFSGYIILNTTFTWPKSLAAAFLLASIGIIFTNQNKPYALLRDLSVGLLLGFACLSHGSSFFAVPSIMIASLLSSENKFISFQSLKSILPLTITFVFIQIPWIFWQRLVDPPGDRLLKWHLGGHVPITNDSFFHVLVSQYRSIGVNGAILNRVANFKVLLGDGHGITLWKKILAGDYKSALSKEFFFHAPAVLTWTLPTAVLIAIFLVLTKGERWSKAMENLNMKSLFFSLFIYIGTMLFWCLAMFGPSTTINHQGTGILIIIPLIIAGSIFANVNLSLFLTGCIIQSIGIYAMYSYQSSDISRLVFAMCEIAIILSGVCIYRFSPKRHRSP